MVSDAVNQFYHADPGSALAALNSANLSEDARIRIASGLDDE